MRDEILEVERRLRDAMLASDVETLDSLLDDRLVFLGPGGGRVGKRDDLNAHRSGFQRLTCLEIQSIAIEEHGDTAICLVDARLEGRFGETPIAGEHRYMRTWNRTPGGWRVVAGCVALLEGC